MAQLKPCTAPGCHTLVSLHAVRCSLHAAARGGHIAEQYGYNRKHWKNLRLRVLERDQYRCQLNVDDQCAGRATTVHLDPALLGNHDDATAADCKSACRHCHAVTDGGRSSTTFATR